MKSCEAYGMSAIVSQFFSIEFEYYQSKNVIRRYNAESVTVTGILFLREYKRLSHKKVGMD